MLHAMHFVPDRHHKKIKQKPTVLRWTIRLMAIYVVFSLCVSFMRSVECRTELNEQYRPKPTNQPTERTNVQWKVLDEDEDVQTKRRKRKNSTMSIRINYQCFLPCLSFIRPFILSFLYPICQTFYYCDSFRLNCSIIDA